MLYLDEELRPMEDVPYVQTCSGHLRSLDKWQGVRDTASTGVHVDNVHKTKVYMAFGSVKMMMLVKQGHSSLIPTWPSFEKQGVSKSEYDGSKGSEQR